RPEQVDALVAAKQRYLDVYNDAAAFARLRAWRESGAAAAGGALVERQIERAYLNFAPYQIEKGALAEMVRREARIENTFNTFRADLDGTKLSDNTLRRLLGSEDGPGGRRRVWEASKQVGAAVAEDL